MFHTILAAKNSLFNLSLHLQNRKGCLQSLNTRFTASALTNACLFVKQINFRISVNSLRCLDREEAIWCFSAVHGLGQTLRLPAVPEWPQRQLWRLEGNLHRQQQRCKSMCQMTQTIKIYETISTHRWGSCFAVIHNMKNVLEKSGDSRAFIVTCRKNEYLQLLKERWNKN